jgi:hypothetical protein
MTNYENSEKSPEIDAAVQEYRSALAAYARALAAVAESAAVRPVWNPRTDPFPPTVGRMQ